MFDNKANRKMKEAFIFIVDDSQDNLQVLGNILIEHGFDVSMANGGREAVDILIDQEEKPDLILLDIMMPGMDGFEVCNVLNSNPATSGIPIIFLTAKTEIKDIVKGFKIGGVDYITKPFEKEELLARVNTHLKLKFTLEDNIRKTNDLADMNNKLISSEANLKKNNTELKELNATKDKFFSIISHDLKNPFNYLLGQTKLLYENYPDFTEEEIQEHLKGLNDTSMQIFTLLKNLLNWSRASSGHIYKRPTDFEAGELIEQCVQLFSDFAAKKEIDLIVTENDKYYCRGDYNMVSTALRNIISNSLKFTSQKGRVEISSEKKGTHIVIRVKDNGVGIPKENLSKIFRIDEQCSTHGTNDEKGTGLGLLLAKEFIEINGGKIDAESEYGKGSSFYLAIPEGSKTNKIIIDDIINVEKDDEIENLRIESKETHSDNRSKEDYDVLQIDINELELVLSKLNSDFLERYSFLIKGWELTKIKHFANDLVSLGKEHNIKYIIKYAENLLNVTKKFDFEKIQSNMLRYPEIIKNLELLVKKQ